MADQGNERAAVVRLPPAWIAVTAGLAGGLGWWGVSLLLGARAHGILGGDPLTGAVSGALTGAVVAPISVAVQRRTQVRALLWLSPLGVYVAIALYALLIHLLRVARNDFHPDVLREAVLAQSVLGMWWAVSLLPHVAIPVHLLAYANHRLLRKLAGSG